MKKLHRPFNGEKFVQLGSVPLRGHEKMDAEQRHREGERIRIRPVKDGLAAFIHPDDLAAHPAQ